MLTIFDIWMKSGKGFLLSCQNHAIGKAAASQAEKSAMKTVNINRDRNTDRKCRYYLKTTSQMKSTVHHLSISEI